jgi:hydroxymethylpyrimidine pyrophosphatase-like HAD family hydrolase
MNEILVFGDLELGIESLKRDGGYLLMDVDGCLAEAGLETAGNLKTVEQWVLENKDELNLLSNNIKSLKKLGIKVGLSTGRGLDFSKKIINGIFPDRSDFLDKSIVEGGLFIYDDKLDVYSLDFGVDKTSVELLESNRQEIIDLGLSLGGVLEPGKKFVALAFNPPLGVDGKRDTDKFRDLLKEKLDKDLADNLVITNSTTGVDITPKGVDKLAALENLVGDREVIYLGDGKNDEVAMRSNKVSLILVPQNSHEDIKALLKSEIKPGILSGENDLRGTNQMLSFLIERF